MTKHLNLKLNLPDEPFAAVKEDELSQRAVEAFVMQLLREHQVSEASAAEILDVKRNDLLSLQAKHEVPTIDLTAEELGDELRRAI